MLFVKIQLLNMLSSYELFKDITIEDIVREIKESKK